MNNGNMFPKIIHHIVALSYVRINYLCIPFIVNYCLQFFTLIKKINLNHKKFSLPICKHIVKKFFSIALVIDSNIFIFCSPVSSSMIKQQYKFA